MAGKTGTAQVVGLNVGSGKGGAWKYRDHGLFIFFAPFDKPRYAGAVVIEHGGGSSAAYPIARDVMTFLFDPAKAMEMLLPMEEGWGGTPQQRLARKYAAYEATYGGRAPKVEATDQATPAPRLDDRSGNAARPIQSEAATPAPEPVGPTPSASSPAPPLPPAE